MSTRNRIPAALGAVALLLAGCSPAQATGHRIAGTTEVVHHPVGNTGSSVDEVREALGREDVRSLVHDHLEELLSKSESFATSFEFERDLLVCEVIHPVPADHEVDHPESVPLADCVKHTFEAHQEHAK